VRLIRDDPSIRIGQCATRDMGDGRSIGELLGELRDDASSLLRQEVELAKSELKESAQRVFRDIAILAVGGLILVLASIAITIGLSAGMYVLIDLVAPEWAAMWLGPLAAALILGAVGAILIQVGRKRLRGERLSPDLTKETMKENKEWIREKLT
jgi:uncharacterized membrane protein YqjE